MILELFKSLIPNSLSHLFLNNSQVTPGRMVTHEFTRLDFIKSLLNGSVSLISDFDTQTTMCCKCFISLLKHTLSFPDQFMKPFMFYHVGCHSQPT